MSCERPGTSISTRDRELASGGDEAHCGPGGEDGAVLTTLAHTSIAHGLKHGRPLAVEVRRYPPALQRRASAFVTLRIDDRLRGCIGSLVPRWALVEDVARHAFASAFEDPRFPRLGRHELPALAIEVSVLGPHRALFFRDEADLIASLRPGIDGLIIHAGRASATFLPAVWDQLPVAADFVGELRGKAGLGPEQPIERAEVYRTFSFSRPAG